MVINQEIKKVLRLDYENISKIFQMYLKRGDYYSAEMLVVGMAQKNMRSEPMMDMLYALYNRKAYYVYKLCYEGDIVYVGSSEQPLKRVNTHKKDKVFDDVFIASCTDKQSMLDFEGLEIYTHRPKYNKSCKLVQCNKIKGVSEYQNIIDFLDSKNIISTQEELMVRTFNIKWKDFMYRRVRKKNNRKNNKEFFWETAFHVRTKFGVPAFERMQNAFKHVPKKGAEESPTEEVTEDSIRHLMISEGIYQLGDIIFTMNDKWRFSWDNKWRKKKTKNSLAYAKKRLADLEKQKQQKCLSFGKHRGKKMEDVFKDDPQYIIWMSKSIEPDKLEGLDIEKWCKKVLKSKNKK